MTESEYFKDTNEKTNTDQKSPPKSLINSSSNTTHILPKSLSITSALPSTALSDACSPLSRLLFLLDFAQRRRHVAIVTIVQLYPILIRLRRWVVLVYHSPSESIAVTLALGDGGKVLVEAGKNDETAAEETEGYFRIAIK